MRLHSFLLCCETMVKAIIDTCCSPRIPCAAPEKSCEDATNLEVMREVLREGGIHLMALDRIRTSLT